MVDSLGGINGEIGDRRDDVKFIDQNPRRVADGPSLYQRDVNAISQLLGLTGPLLPFYSIAISRDSPTPRGRSHVSLAIIESRAEADLAPPRRVNSLSSNRDDFCRC